MSIILAAGQPEGPLLIGFAIAAAAALAIALAAGVFRRRSVVGPQRLEQDESPRSLAAIFVAGVVVWYAVQILFVALRSQHSDAPLTELQNVTIAILAGGSAFSFQALATALYRRDGVGRIGFSFRKLAPGVFVGVLGICIVMPLMFWVTVFTETMWLWLHYSYPKTHPLLLYLQEAKDPRIIGLILFSAIIVAPLFEEMLFRGHLQTLLGSGLRRLLGSGERSSEVPIRWGAILLAAGAFALIHPLWSAPPIFFLALCLGYIYERTGNLWAAITLHACFNALSVAQFVYVAGR